VLVPLTISILPLRKYLPALLGVNLLFPPKSKQLSVSKISELTANFVFVLWETDVLPPLTLKIGLLASPAPVTVPVKS